MGKFETMYNISKRRILGEVIRPCELKTKDAWLSIHGSSKEALLTYESKGLVAAIHGSGSLALDHPQSKEAASLASYIVGQGGIVINGGRKTGVMQTSTQAAGSACVGVLFKELQKESSTPNCVVVSSPNSRVELLATCAPIIAIFRGGMGTLMALMRSIVHVKNRQYHTTQLPQMIFVSSYWIALLTSMMSMGALPREFLVELNFFDSADQIIKKISKTR